MKEKALIHGHFPLSWLCLMGPLKFKIYKSGGKKIGSNHVKWSCICERFDSFSKKLKYNFSGPFSFTWFWIPREGAIQHFDKPLCILNWRQNKRSSTYFHIWNSPLVTALLKSCQQYNIVWLLFLPHHWAENDRCLLTNFCC